MGRRLSGIAMLTCAVVLASCGGNNSVPAVVSTATACLQRAGFPVTRAAAESTRVEGKTRVVQKLFQPGELGALTVGAGPAYSVWILDSQLRARSFAEANGLVKGFDVIGTSVVGPFFPSGRAAALLGVGSSQADRAKIESCLRQARA